MIKSKELINFQMNSEQQSFADFKEQEFQEDLKAYVKLMYDFTLL